MAKRTQGKQQAECAPTPRSRLGTPPALKERLNRAVGFDLRPYREGPKKAKKKGKGAKK